MPGLLNFIAQRQQTTAMKEKVDAEVANLKLQNEMLASQAKQKKAMMDYLEHPTNQKILFGEEIPGYTVPGEEGPTTVEPFKRPPGDILDQLAVMMGAMTKGGAIEHLPALAQSAEKMKMMQGAKEYLDMGKGPVNLQPQGPTNPMAGLIKGAGEGNPEAIAELDKQNAMRKILGLAEIDSRMLGMATPKFKFEKGLLPDGSMGVFSINEKTGKVNSEPILKAKGPEWDFSPPQIGPQGAVTYQYRKDLGLQESFNQGLVSIHQTASPDYEIKVKKNPDGSEIVEYIPKRPGSAMPTSPSPSNMGMPGKTIGGPQLTPPRSSQLVPSEELKGFVGADGNPPRMGMTYGDLEKEKFVPVSATREQAITGQNGIRAIMDSIKGGSRLFKGITPGSRPLSAGTAIWNKLSQKDPQAAFYNDFVLGTASMMIRQLGEKGALATADVQRGINAMPKYFPVPDTEAVFNLKLKTLEDVFDKIKWGNLPRDFQMPIPSPRAAPQPVQPSPGSRFTIKEKK